MSPTRPRPTLQQVALRAGVSRSTAAAALAGSSRVRPETAAKVQEVAVALGYRTTPHARLLRSGGPDVANLVLDTRLCHTPDGAMHPFWARVVTGFLRRMRELGWLCVVQLQEPGVPVLPAPAPGAVIATGDSGQVAMFVRDTFGQKVISPLDALTDDLAQLPLFHDYEQIGIDCARYLAGRGCTRVLLVGRSGFPYSQRILSACAGELEHCSVPVTWAFEGESTTERLAASLTEEVDGILDLSAQPGGLSRGIRSRRPVPQVGGPGDVVVLTNADGADPESTPGMGRLSLEGLAAGALAADFFVTAMLGEPGLQRPQLPYAIYPP